MKKTKNKKGKLIVIDGTDGCGKATQTKLLVKRLRKLGKVVKTIDFPRYYNNFFGQFIGDCLIGMNGDFAKIDPGIASVLYAADRFESGKKMKQWLDGGCVVIADRYVSSNQIHQGGKITNSRKRTIFLEWLDKMEYQIFGIPRPDRIVFLNVPLEISQDLMSKEKKDKKKKYQKGKKDLHENDPEHLANAKKSALDLVKKMNNWSSIECARGGKLMSKNEISDLIWDELKKQL